MITTVCIGIIAAIFFGDLWIKNYIEKNVAEGSEKKLLGGSLLIRRHHNKGMALNWGDKKRSLVAIVSVVFTVVMFAVFICSFGQRGNNLLRVGLALLLGGGFSNTYDRLKRKYVVDYVSFGVKWQGLRKIVFNCSDFCIMIGALLTAIGAYK